MPTYNLLLVGIIVITSYKNKKKLISIYEITNLLKVIIIQTNWQDIQIAECSKIGFWLEK